jgi:chemotaxis protein MotB
MAGHSKRRGRRGGGDHEEHADERWLLTYADMITLLMALFIVMWSMSTVNTSKFEALAKSLDNAFSGQILPGGEAVMANGAGSEAERPAPEPPIPAITPPTPPSQTDPREQLAQQMAPGAAAREEADLQQLKRRVDEVVRAEGLTGEVETRVEERGLVVNVLTDDVLFTSGSALLRPQADGLLDALAPVLKADVRHPIQVEGNTDSVPVSGGSFPSNWELSTDRAAAVVRAFIRRDVAPDRLTALGHADRRPVASNATDAGRRRNRRVELVLLRTQGGTEP